MPIYEGEDACKQCEGWGKVDDGDEGVSWGIWAALPPGADIAVKWGVVKPITCPRCGGTGEDPEGWGGKEPKAVSVSDIQATPSEALYGFVAWLTTRPQVVKLGGSEEVYEGMELLLEFCKVNGFADPRAQYSDWLKVPEA